MATRVFFIGDTHFGHEGALRWAKESRPFNDVVEMNLAIVDRWNSVVRQRDVVYHLGDVAFGGPDNLKWMALCNGHKSLILGNHDHYPINEYLRFFDRVFGVWPYKEFVLSHVPLHEKDMEFRWKYNIHGHIHNGDPRGDKYINVNADVVNLTPVSIEEIRSKIGK